MSPSNFGYGQEFPEDRGGEFSKISFIVRQFISRIATMKLVQVMAVHSNTAPQGSPFASPGTVDVQPLVSQIDGNGNGTPHGIIYGIPWLRLQGGTSIIGLDPVVGDIGLIICADRDISAVKGQLNTAAGNTNTALSSFGPGTRRRYDLADGIYIGSLFGSAPNNSSSVLQFGPADIFLGAALGGNTPSFIHSNQTKGMGLQGLAPPQIFVAAGSSGTYVPPTSPLGLTPLYMIVEGVGGGGGGAGVTTTTGPFGAAGDNTTFSGSGANCTANGGSGGAIPATGASGGSASGGDMNVPGGNGGGSVFIPIANGSAPGGDGGASFFGGGPGITASGNAGESGTAPGSGGAGGAANTNWSGAGGGAGGYFYKLVPNPTGNYSWAVGNGGLGGTAALSGGNGQNGLIKVVAYFQ